MKKRLLSAVLVVLILANLTACSLIPKGENSTENNNDVVPSSNESSEKVEEVCEHQWIEATCTEPKTCSLCGITEGETLEHDFAPATVDSPKKCKVCGFEEGDSVKVTEIPIPEGFFDKGVSNTLGDDYLVSGEVSEDFDEGNGKVIIYDLNGNKLCEDFLYRPEGFNGNSWSYWLGISHNLIFWLFTDNSNKAKLEVYKFNGNELEQIYESDVTTGSYKRTDTAELKIRSENYYGVSTCGYTFYYDVENNCLCSEDDTIKEKIEYDDSIWSCYEECPVIDGYFVGTKDGSSWGYLDKDGNEIAMYADASDFIPNGYAIISEDGKSYSIIDKDFNIVGDGLYEGISGCRLGYYSNIFTIYQEDGNVMCIKVE